MAVGRYPGFSSESRAIISELENYGWTFRVTKRGHAIGRAPDGVTTASVPMTLSRANRSQQNTMAVLNAWRRKVIEAAAQTGLDKIADATYLHDGPPDPVIDEVLDRARRKRARETAQILATPSESEAPTIVATSLWLSRMASSRERATTNLVENERVQKRTWSDGTVDYACLWDGCDYTHTSPRSVAVHYGQKHTKREGAEPRDAAARVPVAVAVPIDVETMRSRTYHPSDRLIAALAAFLLEHGDMGGVEETAHAALLWFHDRPDLEDAETRERAPMTDAEILARVRLLVGGRDVALEERFAEQQAVVADLEATVARLETLRAEEATEHARVRADLEAWLSLAPRQP